MIEVPNTHYQKYEEEIFCQTSI